MPTQVTDHKHRVNIARIKETVNNENVVVHWCPGGEMLANPLTKRGANSDNLLKVLQRGNIHEHFKRGRASGIDLAWRFF